MDKENHTEQLLDKLLSPEMFRTFRLAIQPSKIFLAFIAVATICLGGWLLDFSMKVHVAPADHQYTENSHIQKPLITELDLYLCDPLNFETNISKITDSGSKQGVFTTLWAFSRTKFNGILSAIFAFDFKAIARQVAEFARATEWIIKYHFIFCVLFAAITLSVIAVCGGAICRMAALQYAKGEKTGMMAALSFSLKRFTSFFTAPLLPLLLIIIIGLFIFVAGLLTNIPHAGGLIAGLLTPLILIAGAIVAALFIGGIAGLNLMFPAICYDGSDCFDAMSRALSYVYARPWCMAFYTSIATVYGAVCYLFVRLYVFIALFSAHLFLQTGIWTKNETGIVNKLTVLWPQPTYLNLISKPLTTPCGFSEQYGALLINLFSLFAIGLIIAFIISFYFSANTIIYTALRRKVDQTGIEDIYIENENTKI